MPSRQTVPRKLWKATSKAQRQTVAGQLGRTLHPKRDERNNHPRKPVGTLPRPAEERRTPPLHAMDVPRGNPFSLLSNPDDGSQDDGPVSIKTIPVRGPALTGALLAATTKALPAVTAALRPTTGTKTPRD